ncbi:Putative F-box/LRR-repeat protein [Morus notabilis]|uniref:Putative F-box/LRR-repeat protein n=1 Tax=Morus notabilis TaxID=981085 RepID=W9RIL8_9ROSA|nr:Putative F-box/LRR-repeat protein [Morus notabilis]
MATKRVKPNFRDQDTSAALDRISRLPDPVIHRILSFIPTIDVVRMSLLSKRWRRMWYSVPSLEFSDADITHSAFHSRKRFCNFVDKCLKHREASMRYISDSFITRFKLDIEYYGGRSALDNWLSFVIRSNVEEFDLRAKPKFEWSYISDSFYCLPEAVLSAGSLNVLKLEGLKLNGACSVSLPSLKTLSLTAAELNDHILCGLVMGCPSLDKILLKNCMGLSNPRISSLSLKFLEIRYSSCQTLKVEAINAESFTYSGYCEDINISACRAIKSLSLLNNWLDDKSLEDIIFGLPLLESLTLRGCYKMKSIKICGQHLKNITLEKVFIRREEVELSIETPNQVSFCYQGDVRFSLKMKSPNLSNGNFVIRQDSHDNVYDNNWYIDMITFLSNMNFSWNCVDVHVYKEEALIFPENLRRICGSPWLNLKNLKVKTYCYPENDP